MKGCLPTVCVNSFIYVKACARFLISFVCKMKAASTVIMW